MGYSSSRDEDHSSMRLNMLLASFACFFLLLVIAAYILIMAIKHQGVSDWAGLGIFAGLLLAGLGVNAFAKASQKKFEIG